MKQLKALGNLVRAVRKERHLSQLVLAKEIGVSREWIKRIEHAEIDEPGAQKIAHLAVALGLRPRELLLLAGQEYPEDTVTLHPERFDPQIVRLAEYLQTLPIETRGSTVRICESYAILQKSLGTRAATVLLENLRKVAEQKEPYGTE